MCIHRKKFFFVPCGKCISDQKCKNRNSAALRLIPFCISFELAGLSAYFREMLFHHMPASNFQACARSQKFPVQFDFTFRNFWRSVRVRVKKFSGQSSKIAISVPVLF